MSEDSRVRVAVRIRPKLENAVSIAQTAERYQPEAASKVNDTTIRLSEMKGRDTKSYAFGFDFVFDKDSTQEELYNETTAEAVDRVLEGFNATIMTYGQTGSGKTYTVLGEVRSNPLSDDVLTSETGLFLRVLRDMLHVAQMRESTLHTVFSLSCMEIYMENVRDLLGKDCTQALRLVIDAENVSIPDLAWRPVTSLRDAISVYKVATSRRVSRATDANDMSSRSHALFAIDIFQQPRDDKINPEPPDVDDLMRWCHDVTSPSDATSPITGFPKPLPSPEAGLGDNMIVLSPGQPPIMHSRMVLADLAGSEKLKFSNATGNALEETKRINGSLTALGNVVHSLYSAAKHIPYRDSKLTIILRSSFAAPNSRVVLIANVAPTELTFDETLSTLHFANKVKQIKTAPLSGIDMQLEADFLADLRLFEELGAEMRILQSSVERSGFPALRSNAPKLFLATTLIKGSKERAAEVQRTITALFEKIAKYDEETKANVLREAAKQRDEMLSRIKTNFFATREKLAKEMQIVENDSVAFGREEVIIGNAAKSKAAPFEQVLAAATKAREEVEAVRNEKLAIRAKQREEENALAAVDDTLRRQLVAEHATFGDQEDDWQRTLDSGKRKDGDWDKAAHFVGSCTAFQDLKLKFMQLSLERLKLSSEAATLQKDVEREEVASWMNRVLVQIATGIQQGRFKKGETTSVTLIPAARVVRPKATAPKERPRSLYDNPQLTSDIIQYLRGGAVLVKHGRRGTPHYRFFFVIPGQNRLHRLFWKEPEDAHSRRPGGSSVNLSEVTKVTLGQYSEVFSRSKAKENFYFSLSLHYEKEGVPRTLDIECETDAEYEAWAIGLCHLCGRSPEFGGALEEVNQLPGAEALNPDELAVCSRWHVQPIAFSALRERITALAKRLNGKARLTPGDLRQISRLDIFRASAVWTHFHELALVTDLPSGIPDYLYYDEAAALTRRPTASDLLQKTMKKEKEGAGIADNLQLAQSAAF